MDRDKIVLLWADAGTDDENLVATFTGPEALERANEVQRLKSLTGRDDQYAPHYSVTSVKSNPDNKELGLAPPLAGVETSDFVEAAIASAMTYGHATVPAWLNIEWLVFEAEQLTNEKFRIDGRIIRLDPPQRWIQGADQVDSALDGAGFVESEQY